MLRSIVAGAGGDPRKVKTITIGFNAVAALLAGRVAAATAFWNDEGVTLRRGGPGFHVFRVDHYGAPSYPELVLCATAPSCAPTRASPASVVRALVRGYGFTAHRPAAQRRRPRVARARSRPDARRREARRALPAFSVAGGNVGELDPARSGLGELGGAVRDRLAAARRRPDVRPALRRGDRVTRGGY